MNWRAGFKRIELVYAVAALAFSLHVAFNEGGQWTGYGGAWSRLAYPNETWIVSYPDEAATTRLSNLPFGSEEEWVRAELAKVETIPEGSRFVVGEQVYFHWVDALSALAESLAVFGLLWLAVKVTLWIVNGFRGTKPPSGADPTVGPES